MEWLCEHHVDSLQVAQCPVHGLLPTALNQVQCQGDFPPAAQEALWTLKVYPRAKHLHGASVTQPRGHAAWRWPQAEGTGACVHIPAIPSLLSILHETYNSPSKADSVLLCMMSLCTCTVLMSLPLASTCSGPPGFACCNVPTTDVTVQATNQPGSNMPTASRDESLTSCTSSPSQSLIPSPISCLLAQHRLQSYRHLPLSAL